MNTKQLYYPFASRSQYSTVLATGDMAAGLSAPSDILHFRNPDTSGKLIVIQEITLNGMRATTAFAAGKIDIQAFVCRSFTANGTGGATPTLTGDQNQLRTSMLDSILNGAVRVATTAALGAGTKTPDTLPFGSILTHSSAGWQGATPIIGSVYIPSPHIFKALPNEGEYPLILAQDEGFSIAASVPATGVWNASFRIKWAEVDGF